jgi:hypothetical protein
MAGVLFSRHFRLLIPGLSNADDHEVPYFMEHPFDSFLIAIPFCFLVCFPYYIARVRGGCNTNLIGFASILGLALLPFSVAMAGRNRYGDRYDPCALACWWAPGIIIWFTALMGSFSDQTVLQRRALQELQFRRALQFREQMSHIGRKDSVPQPIAQNPIT